MKIGLYNEPDGQAIGGCEYLVAVIAESLQHEHDVEIIHRKPRLCARSLSEFSGTNLSSVSIRSVGVKLMPPYRTRNPLKRLLLLRSFYSELSKNYDFFIAFVCGYPPYCHSSRGLTVITFPCVIPEYHDVARANSSWFEKFRHLLRKAYYRLEWYIRFQSYCGHTTISHFSQDWVRQRWGINSKVIYPPAQLKVTPSEKQKSILSVGRFATIGTSKNQFETVSLYSKIHTKLQGWNYFVVGALSENLGDQDYFAKVKSQIKDAPISLLANLNREELEALYASSSIFWHAAGLSEQDHLNPETVEHFGIVTVEAMATGCIPVVINRGGQKEIVEHGKNGFLWNNLDELEHYTLRLASDPALRKELSAAAIRRSLDFTKSAYVEKYRGLIEHHSKPK